MIGSLRGQLLARDDAELLLEVAGVGYRVQVAPTTGVSVGDLGDEVFLFTHHHLKDDASRLFGFMTLEERRTFEALLGTNGVGPALALAILSVHAPPALRQAVATDDIATLTLVPGVGRKTAARLLIDLKSRLDVPEGDPAEVARRSDPGRASLVPGPLADVREALTGLGYGPDEIREALRDVPDEGDPAELLRLALGRLATR